MRIMAVADFLSRDTEAFVLPSKSYYPLKIPITHYQLRHFISSPEQDLLYYASGADVYCLNTATRTQAHLTTLPWEARCTAAAHGYVCVGGEESGNFAAIKIAGFPPADPADVDALLPLHLPNRVNVPRAPLLGSAHRIRLERIGQDIVNSISIHKLPASGNGEDEVVAVLTNNDKTVRIYSLTQNLEVAVLDLPFAMNHGTISPDGEILVAVGDQPTCFFFRRVKSQRPNTVKTVDTRAPSAPSEWELFEEICLYVPPGTHQDGYFTTAWSTTGRLCAVGSECGYITVFDIELLKRCEYGEDAIVQLISSTRPDVTVSAGAVRTMQFAPAPWDLLIWSEDQARVCVADLRSDLKVKQVLVLDPKEKDLEKVEIADFDLTLSPELQDLRRETDFIRRYRRALDSEGTAAATNFATDYIENWSERRRLHRRMGVVESDNDPHGLTAYERQVLETLRTTRPRDEPSEQGITPRSINYNTSGLAESRRYDHNRVNFLSELRAHTRRERDTREERQHAAQRSIASGFGEIMPESAIQANETRERNRGHERTTPRRQASVIVSINDNGDDSNAPPTGNITDSATTRSPNPIPAHARRGFTSDIVQSTNDAWRTLEAELSGAPRGTNLSDRPSALSNTTPSGTGNPELRTELRRLRQLTQMRDRLRSGDANPIDTFGLRAVYRQRGYMHDPSLGVRTAGLAMSQDGRTLYCGTEEGIFEFQINVHERKGFPAITPR